MNTTCVLGQSFLFRCRTSPNAIMARWFVNGKHLKAAAPPPGVTLTSFNNLFKLEMTCIVGRHFNTVQCMAVISNEGSIIEERSPFAVLRVQGLIF